MSKIDGSFFAFFVKRFCWENSTGRFIGRCGRQQCLLLLVVSAIYLIYLAIQPTALPPKSADGKSLGIAAGNRKSKEMIGMFLAKIGNLQKTIDAHRDLFNYSSTFLHDTPYPGIANYTRYAVARLEMLPLADAEALKPEFGPVVNDVTSFRYPVSIPPCRNVTSSAARTVFIAVISAAGNFDKRDVIRQTWLRHLNDEHRQGFLGVSGFAFILGQAEDDPTRIKVEEESKSFGDIIQIEMSDFYRNLSSKVAGLLNWLRRNCARVELVLKVDDDVYVNVRNLAHFLQSYHRQSNQTMFGLAANKFAPNRVGKWGINFDEWPWNQYPPYFFGPAVLMSGTTVLPLLAAFQTTPMMPFDDVYLTGMCTEKAGIRIRFSCNSTKILALEFPDVPLPCDVRRFVAWLTVSGHHMKTSHQVTDDFYRNNARCTVADSDGFNRTVDPNEFVQFDFT